MRILIDAMGGDHAPEAIVKGAIDAAAEFGVQIVLVGRGEAILKSLTTLGLDTLPKGVEVIRIGRIDQLPPVIFGAGRDAE